jgi:hypothetical protein
VYRSGFTAEFRGRMKITNQAYISAEISKLMKTRIFEAIIGSQHAESVRIIKKNLRIKS